MNYKIKEFERESGLDVYGLGTDRDKWEAAVEKFADLIISECANIFPMTFADEQHQRRIDKTIKKHFDLYDRISHTKS